MSSKSQHAQPKLNMRRCDTLYKFISTVCRFILCPPSLPQACSLFYDMEVLHSSLHLFTRLILLLHHNKWRPWCVSLYLFLLISCCAFHLFFLRCVEVLALVGLSSSWPNSFHSWAEFSDPLVTDFLVTNGFNRWLWLFLTPLEPLINLRFLNFSMLKFYIVDRRWSRLEPPNVQLGFSFVDDSN